MVSVLGFYSWVERGLAPFLTEGETVADGPYVDADVLIAEEKPSGSRATRSIPVRLDLAAPRHVVGIEPGIVTRVWPKAGVTDAETDYFPLVEFADADFPWRYSPVRRRLDDEHPVARHPWVALVVLREDELTYSPAGATRRLPSIRVAPASLPPTDELYLWAHTQVTGAPSSEGAVEQTLREHPERALSRLICPRFLSSQQRYRAFLVPTYRAGAEAGFGLPVTDQYVLAWAGETETGENETIELPVYYEWSFVTGDVGSFHDLARRLVPRVLTGTGTRTMDVSHPGLSALDQLSATVEVGGALRPFEAAEYAWPPAEQAAWRTNLAGVLEPAIELADDDNVEPPRPTLAPPLYGRWYADADAISGEPGGAPAWFQTLDEAPHQRVPAALGTAAVQADQQALMASAWQQVDGLLAANQQIRQAQLAREASLQSYRRHVTPAPRPGRVLQLASAVFGRVRMPGGNTVLDAIRRSPIPDGFFDAAWRRLTRPLGPLGRRQGRPGRQLPPPERDTIDDLNDGTLDPSHPMPPALPDGAIGPGAGNPGECPHCLAPEIVDVIRGLTPAQAYQVGMDLFVEGREYTGFGTPWRVAVMRLGAMLVEAAATPGGVLALVDRIERECLGTPDSDDLDAVPPVEPDWTPVEPVPDAPGTPPGPPPEGTTPSEDETAFREAAGALLDTLNQAPPEGLELTKVDVAVVHTRVVNALDPAITIAAALRRRLSTQAPWNPADALEPLLVVPEFQQPMYEGLRAISTEWILPGIGEIAANTLSMVTPNQGFIEAYMVGLNHEMGRELLWHEYPNDLRGTYFRQFWDVRGQADPSADPRDIAPIHTWGDSELGDHRPLAIADRVVLFVRGDLLHRYPQVVVYLARATAPLPTPPSPDGPQPGTEEKYPLFRGALGSDAAIHGFDLTRADARGTATTPGWYVLFQEPPGEPRFGFLDDPGVPRDSFLRTNSRVYDELVPDGEVSPARAALALYCKPTRVAFHAATMLPL
jgi:hypothetical protein